jgi:hypothetical protein
VADAPGSVERHRETVVRVRAGRGKEAGAKAAAPAAEALRASPSPETCNGAGGGGDGGDGDGANGGRVARNGAHANGNGEARLFGGDEGDGGGMGSGLCCAGKGRRGQEEEQTSPWSELVSFDFSRERKPSTGVFLSRSKMSRRSSADRKSNGGA